MLSRGITYPHSRVQGASNLVVLLQPWATSEYFWQPELTDGTLHVTNLALGWLGRLYPLRRLPANTTDHVGMSKGLRGALLGLCAKGGGNWLGDPRVEGRGAAGDDEAAVEVVTSDRTVAGLWPGEGGRCGEGRSHGCCCYCVCLSVCQVSISGRV